jgi:hypothetical protein
MTSRDIKRQFPVTRNDILVLCHAVTSFMTLDALKLTAGSGCAGLWRCPYGCTRFRSHSATCNREHMAVITMETRTPQLASVSESSACGGKTKYVHVSGNTGSFIVMNFRECKFSVCILVMGVRLTSHYSADAFTGLLLVPGWEWMSEWLSVKIKRFQPI